MKYLLGIIIFILSFFCFSVLEYGKLVNAANELIQPVLFSFVLAALYINKKSSKFIFIISTALLIVMILLYFFNVLELANLAGSLGAGFFIILLFSFTPNLIKNGHI